MRIVLSFALLLTITCVVPRSPGAQLGPDIYTVSGVAVDVTAEDVIAARRQAVEQGQREGLRRLLERLTAPGSTAQLPNVANIPLVPLVRGFGVENERTSSNRYIAEVETSFRGDAVQALLEGREIAVVLTASPPLLVVPVRREAGSELTVLSADDPWFAAWGRHGTRNTLLDIRLPLGDLLDAANLRTGSNAESGLAQLAGRYGTDAAVLVVATGGPDNPSGLLVTTEAAYNWSYAAPSVDLPGQAAEGTSAGAWNRAVASVLERMQNRWKADNAVRLSQAEDLAARVTLNRLDDWVAVKRVLEKAPEIRGVTLRSLSQTEAALTISFVGGVAQLAKSLENRGISVVEETGQWLLQAAADRNAG